MSLTGDQTRQLVNALAGVGDLDVVKRIVKFGLGEDLPAVVAANKDLNSTVFDLVAWADRTGGTADLIRAAVSELPGNLGLKDLIKQPWVEALLAAFMEAPSPGKVGILIDRSHGQQNWQLPFISGRADRVLQLSHLPPSSAMWDLRAIDQKTQINADQLKAWRGLIFAIPHNMPIDEATRNELVQWVRQGGRLVLLGFELGVRHHRTNLNELAGDFGLRFNSDIVAAKDHQPPENPYEKPIDFRGIASQHPLFQGVNSLRLRNLCTLTVEPGADILMTLGDHSIGWLQTEGVIYSTEGWLLGGNKVYRYIKDAAWVPVIAAAPAGLTGQGSVLAIGTWQLLERSGSAPANFDNRRFIENLLTWCGG
jgi:hypothetical protein